MSERLVLDLVQRRRPLAVRPETTIAETCRRMDNRHVGAALITDADGSLVGIFTGRDAVRALSRRRDPGDAVGTVMMPEPHVIGPGCTPAEALEIMRDRGFRHLPIVDGARVVGLVSWGDFRAEQEAVEPHAGYWE